MRKFIALALAVTMAFAATSALAQGKKGSNGKGTGAASGEVSRI